MAFKKSYLFLSLSLVSSLMGGPTWTNATTDNLWVTPGNWNPAAVPVNGDTPIFPATPGGIVDYTTINSPNFSSMTITTNTTTYTFTAGVGDAISFAPLASLILNGTLGGTDIGGALSLFGPLNINSNNTGIAPTEISAQIDQVLVGSLNISGTGPLLLSSLSSTYTGNTTLNSNANVTITGNNSLGASNTSLILNNNASFTLAASMTFTHPTILNNSLVSAPKIIVDAIANTVTFNGVISGAGNFIKDGPGTLILNGTNLYSGGTTVNAGILAINVDNNLGASGSALTLNIGSTLQANASSTSITSHPITLGGNATFDTNGNTFSISSSITGGGSLTKISAGTLILTGANSYTGDTNVNGGTLAINNDGNLGNIVSNLNLNAGTTLQANASTTTLSAQHPIFLTGATNFDSNGNTFSISSPITNTGSLTKIGSGTLILTGTSNYSGGTTVSAGTLQGDTNGIQGPITNNTAVVFDQTFTGNYSGSMDGSGSLTKQNTGTVVLTGINTYSGGTTISGGTLQGNTTSLQGNIIDNASLVFDQAASGSFAGTISGSGTVTKQNSGILQFNGAQSYTGGTTINGGSLEVNGSIVGPVALNAGTFDVENSFTITDWTGAPGSFAILGSGFTLTFGTANSTTVASAISGLGGLTKQGSGTVIFSGASTYTGPTQINAGTLVVNGSITSPTTVAAGATLKGTGTIASSLIVNGTLRPGNSVGTLNVAGPVTFNAGSTFAVELDPAKASLLNVTAGGVTINPGSTLSILPNPGSYTVGSTYPIIQTAGGVVTGTFSTVTNSSPLLVFSVLYTPNLVQLSLDKVGSGFSTLFPSGNVGAVAKCLDAANPAQGSDLNNIITQLIFAPAKEIKHALNQMQPSQYNALQLSQENVDTRILSVLSLREAQLHRACNPKEQTWGIWADVFGDVLQQDHQNGQYGFHAETGAALIGFDGQATCDLHLGFGGAYTWTNLKWAGHHGNSHNSSGYGFAYGTWNVRHFFLDASFVGGYNNYETKRHIDFLAIDRRAKSEHHGYTLAGRLTGGVPFKAWKAEIAPLISVDYDFVHQTSFKEHGAKSLNLHIHEKNANLLRGEAGFRVTRRCTPELKVDPCTQQEICVSDARWLPSFQLTVIREWRFQGERYRSRLQDLDCTFTTEGLNPDRTLIAPAIGITYLAGDRWEMTLDYAGEFDVKGKYWDQKGNFQISYAF